ncbi:MAG TPA: Hsp20/alpha crystallin family protein [Anaerolineales bacterium]|nr:Hsp20/alpha crystallin family protein [Anaerolineales bacterium]HNN14116.1 Hsp20/alpha crystallin family protein [Anaerolineales bacterium]
MPTVVRRSRETLVEVRREILHAVSWQVRSSVWCPPTDVYETDDVIVARMEIAGMRDEDFEVSVENNTLHIVGDRSDFPERRAYHQMEIRFGKFAVTISLPKPVDVEKASAEYQDGFLVVHLPKSKTGQHKG